MNSIPTTAFQGISKEIQEIIKDCLRYYVKKEGIITFHAEESYLADGTQFHLELMYQPQIHKLRQMLHRLFCYVNQHIDFQNYERVDFDENCFRSLEYIMADILVYPTKEMDIIKFFKLINPSINMMDDFIVDFFSYHSCVRESNLFIMYKGKSKEVEIDCYSQRPRIGDKTFDSIVELLSHFCKEC